MSGTSAETLCPCGSQQTLQACCGRFHAGPELPATAEALMRSRYAAFALGDVAYLEATLTPQLRQDFDPAAVARWNKNTRWAGLTIHAVEGGGPGDTAGLVAFTARFERKGAMRELRERSMFVCSDGRWLYDGQQPAAELPQAPARTDKTGRNAPCPCGSGKKFKKCCG